MTFRYIPFPMHLRRMTDPDVNTKAR